MSDALSLAKVIASVESGNNAYAIRFEPGLFSEWTKQALTPPQRAVVLAAMKANDCSFGTAIMLACTSWGQYQILGENLYSVCGLQTSVGVFMAGAAQDDAFTTFVRARGVDFTLDDIQTDPAKRERFIAAYNGPGNIPSYWSRMQNAISYLSGAVDQT